MVWSGGWGGVDATVYLKNIQLIHQPHVPRLLKGTLGIHVKKLVFVAPTAVLWGIMYRACHIVSLPHVFTPAT